MRRMRIQFVRLPFPLLLPPSLSARRGGAKYISEMSLPTGELFCFLKNISKPFLSRQDERGSPNRIGSLYIAKERRKSGNKSVVVPTDVTKLSLQEKEERTVKTSRELGGRGL